MGGSDESFPITPENLGKEETSQHRELSDPLLYLRGEKCFRDALARPSALIEGAIYFDISSLSCFDPS